MTDRPAGTSWRKISEREQKLAYRWVTYKTFRMPDNSEQEYTTYGKPGNQNAAIIALTTDNQVVLARQFRAGPELLFEELPGGGVEDNHTPEETVIEELREETGFVAERIEYLGKACRDAYTNDVSHYFIGYGCSRQTDQELLPGEFIDVVTVPVSRLLDNALQYRMSDIPAVLMAYDKLKEIYNGANG